MLYYMILFSAHINEGSILENKKKSQNQYLFQVKNKISPITGQKCPRGFQEVKVPRLRDNDPGWW
jgi:hypothetical protein